MNPVQSLSEAPTAPGSSPHEQHSQLAQEQLPSPNTPRHVPAISPTSAPVPMHHQQDDEPPRLPPPATPASSTSHPIHQTGFTPIRKDTSSSISTQATLGSAEINIASYSAETSPNLHHSIFSAKDGSDVSNSRRASRRRTGPLSQLSRERAALIRKLGACPECRRRRVACHPSHHGLTWENLAHKFSRSHSPTIPDIAPNIAAGRALSPSTSQGESHALYSHHEGSEMDIDPSSSSHHAAAVRLPLSEARLRTPLPSGPRLEKSLSLPGIETLKNELQANATKIVSSNNRGRYNDVRVLMIMWQADEDAGAGYAVMRDLAEVLEKQFRYSVHIESIPVSDPGVSKSAWKWVSQLLDGFLDSNDQRDMLKIVYYGGHTILDGNRELNLASSRDMHRSSLVRWNTVQQRLEHAVSDTFVIMDAAFYPCTPLARRHGVLEIIAASLSDDHINSLGRFTFTRLLIEQLRISAARMTPLSVAELHSILFTSYPKIVRERQPENELVTSYPAPFHAMTAANSRLPSIFIGPNQHRSPLRPGFIYENSPQLHVTIKVADENPVDIESWNEWLRLMPEGIRDVKIEGPFRPAFG